MDNIKQYFLGDHFAAHCGISLESVSPGKAVASMVVEEKHLNALGIAQGGAVFTLADFAFAAASNSHGEIAVAVNVSISFLKAARPGRLRAEAREISRNRKLASYVVEVKDVENDLVAHFQGMVYRKGQAVPGATTPVSDSGG